jgi:predicted MPP superfamily phosphohydrolase
MPGTFVIGDIHGALKALKQVIAAINPEKDDRLIFLGDYVDGWSQSAQVINYLIGLEKKYACLFLKGNHDAWCESWLEGAEPDELWLHQGGMATVASYRNYSPKQKEKHLAFFERMLNYYVDQEGRLFVHAGFASTRGPANEHHADNFTWDRTLWEMALALDDRLEKDSVLYPKRLLLFDEIYIGHTPTTNYDVEVPMQAANVWNIDTGAAFYGRISAMDIQTKKFWQSDIVQRLYPKEKGRN